MSESNVCLKTFRLSVKVWYQGHYHNDPPRACPRRWLFGLVESWLPWWTTSSGNLTETNPSYSGVPPSSGAPDEATGSRTTSVWWSEWNFKVLFGWTNYAVFSTPDRKGSLGTDGGWALYFVDKFGVLCFGQYWPVAGWTALAASLTLLVTALAWSFRTCERCLCCGGGCCRRGRPPHGGALDPALRHLPETPVPPAYSSVTFVGPDCATPVDTEYYQRKVRGRGAGRRPRDLVLQFPHGAVRLQPDWSQRTRVDRHGLWITPGRSGSHPWRHSPEPA